MLFSTTLLVLLLLLSTLSVLVDAFINWFQEYLYQIVIGVGYGVNVAGMALLGVFLFLEF